MYKRVGMAIALVMLTATMLLAHDLFLKLETYFVPPNSSVRVAVLNGTFATSEGAVTAVRLRDLSLVGPAERMQLPRDNWKPVGDTTWLTIPTSASGTYLLGASLLPREIALSAEEFNSYLREDGIPDVLDDRTRSGTLTQAVRERYQKHVKAVFQVGDTRTLAYSTVLGYRAIRSKGSRVHRPETGSLSGLAQASPCENLLSAVEFETELLILTQLVWGRGEL